MNEQKEANSCDNRDAAWVVIYAPLSTAELKLFCKDIERLFRINPMLNFKKWQSLGSNRYYFSGQNISQDPPFDFELTLAIRQLSDGIEVEYAHGLKTRTTLIIQPLQGQQATQQKNQSILTITDYYDRLPENERTQQLHLVDKSLTVWANDLHQFLIYWKKWSRYGPWRWFMHHVWQPMKPMGRRITYILFWVTFFELALILLGAAVYYLEYTE
ncbi:hypothetical protein [Nitrosomonas aestuarii]|uniref:hypothetical protein n=1 Tax=Nitrosomonas aestuarii TaxID=52441 RepID=UPI000D32409E|nr:hypothetical protein [Nitrosomonas aestuarii]PTN12175.1 hypothetical protein C8R11_105138 [Nitrosomonas aestuarii]